MIQIRYNIFETNSSSTMTFAVDICQVEELEIPSVVHIESGGFSGDNDINGVYAWVEWQHQTEQFFGLLKYSGVKEIYVDGKLVDADPEDRFVKILRPEVILAKCFGDFKCFSEWMGHGNEWDCSQYLTKEQIKTVQTMIKDPKYIIICTDEDGNEIDWDSTRYAKMVITDEEIEAEREYLARKKEYDEYMESEPDYDYDYDYDYNDDEPQTLDDLRAEDAAWEDSNFYLTKKNRHNKKKNRKR